jgi:hypothetical protein
LATYDGRLGVYVDHVDCRRDGLELGLLGGTELVELGLT